MATFTVAERSHAASLTAFPHPIGPWTTPPSGPLPSPRQNCRGLFSKGPLPAGALQAPSAATIVTRASAPAMPQVVPCASRPQGEDPLEFADNTTFTAAERCEWTVKLQWDGLEQHGRRRRHQV